jgi:thiamine phosphate synthase YjbQ (UPF0047 family)
MTVITKFIQAKSVNEDDLINLTDQISGVVEECKIDKRVVTVFVSGSTASVTTAEPELVSNTISGNVVRSGSK